MMNNVNISLVLTSVGYLVLLTLIILGGYLQVIPAPYALTLIPLIIGNFMGVLVPSPLNKSTTTGSEMKNG